LIQYYYDNSIKSDYSEYFIEFSLVNTEKYPLILEAFQMNGNRFHFFSPEFSCQTLDYLSTIEKVNLYTNCFIRSSGNYEDDAIGYSLQIDNENLELVLDIGLPYSNLELSKKLLSELIRHLNSEGIHLGFSDYNNIEEYIDQLINLNSTVKPSFTWQLNLSNYSYSHSNGYASNSNYSDKDNKTYRMRGINIGFPKHYFKHKNIEEHNKINNYSSRLIAALSKYFSDTCRIQFTSKNLKLLTSCKSTVNDNFKLSSMIDLRETVAKVKETDLRELFETGYNNYTLNWVRLNEEHDFQCKLSIVKEDDNDTELLIYSRYKIDMEEENQKKIEDVLNIELDYYGAE